MSTLTNTLPIQDLNEWQVSKFALGGATGLIGAGAGAASEIYQFRWTSTASKAAIISIGLSVGAAGTAFAAGTATFDAAVARAWTVAGTGGTTITPATNDCKLRVGTAASGLGSFAFPSPTSLVSEVRIATTAALGAGTKTLDAQPIGSITTGVAAVAGQQLVYGSELFSSYLADAALILTANEGFVIRATVPITGTWTASINIIWAEYPISIQA